MMFDYNAIIQIAEDAGLSIMEIYESSEFFKPI